MSTAVHTPIGTAGAGTVRAIRIVWKRELIRFARDRARMITARVPLGDVPPVLGLFSDSLGRPG